MDIRLYELILSSIFVLGSLVFVATKLYEAIKYTKQNNEFLSLMREFKEDREVKNEVVDFVKEQVKNKKPIKVEVLDEKKDNGNDNIDFPNSHV